MSYQSQTAVTLHSKQNDIKRLRLLLYLANNATADGVVDPAPNQETLADFLGVTTRTIRTYLNEIAADGELEQTRVGSGPGNPSAYRILLPHDAPQPDRGSLKAEIIPDNRSAFSDLKAEISALKAENEERFNQLKAEISALKADRETGKGGKADRKRRIGLSTESAVDPYYDPSYDPKNHIHIAEHPPSDTVAELMSALSLISKTPLGPGINEDTYRAAAETVLGWDATPQTVAGFTEWWDLYGYYDGLPALSSVLSEFRNYLAGKRPSSSSPPRSSSAATGSAAATAASYLKHKKEMLS